MAVQTGEGTVEIIYQPSSVPAGPRTLGGFLARPALEGQWPTVMVFGDEPIPTSPLKYLCMVFARHGLAAFAPDFTVDPVRNLSIARAVAAFFADPAGNWSNAQHGYGLVAFGSGATDLAALAATDFRADAFATVGSSIDDVIANKLADAAIPGLVIVSRGDTSVDVDATVSHRDALSLASFVVYPTGDAGFWNDDAEGYDDTRAKDAMSRVIEFFQTQLPERI
ncbi:MAG: dienelactone hydrolase family protein [Acidimicrobiia bacterium]|nr:dienelactone hydrolase family protein [Acidimicrobiia bacterium]